MSDTKGGHLDGSVGQGHWTRKEGGGRSRRRRRPQAPRPSGSAQGRGEGRARASAGPGGCEGRRRSQPGAQDELATSFVGAGCIGPPPYLVTPPFVDETDKFVNHVRQIANPEAAVRDRGGRGELTDAGSRRRDADEYSPATARQPASADEPDMP